MAQRSHEGSWLYRLTLVLILPCLVLWSCSDGGSTPVSGDDTDTGGPGFRTRTGDTSPGNTGGDTGGGGGKPGEAAAIDTAVSAGTVAAGSAVTVTCTVLDGVGDPMDASAATWVVTPSGGPPPDGAELTLTQTGSFEVACQLGDLVDPSPAAITVVPGPAATSTAGVSPATTKAGEPAAVVCVVLDAYGNATAQGVEAVVDPPADVAITGMQVSSTVAGDYEVSCAVAGAGDELEVTPAPWTVEPSAPLSMILVFKPDELAYDVDQAVTVTGSGVDTYGNQVDDILVSGLGATPDGHHTVVGDAGNKIRFDAEGKYTVGASAAEWPTLTAARALVVDQTPPSILITNPQRGFAADGVDSVMLEGEVTDNLGVVAWVEIMGQPLALPPEGGPFTVNVPLKYGMNLLHVKAADPYDHVAETSRSVLWTTAWYPLEAPSIDTDPVIHALVAALSQDGIDDGVHDHDNPDDLATLLEKLLAGFDLGALLPDPLTTFGCIGGDCEFRITSLTFQDPEVELTLMSGGLHLSMEIKDFAGNIELEAPCDIAFVCSDPTIVLPGGLTAAKISLEADVGVTIDNGQLVVTASKTSVDIYDIALVISDPTGGWLDSIINGALDFVEPALLGILEGAFPYLIESQIGGLLDSFADALAIDQELDIPALADDGDPNTVVIATEPADILFTPQYMRLAMNAVAHAKTSLKPYPEVPGSLRYDGCGKVGTLPVPPQARIAVAAHDDLLNQLAYAVWDGGTLSLNLGPEDASALDLSQYGITLSEISVDPLLPIVVNSCTGDNRAQIGDLFLQADLTFLGTPSQLGLWLQADAELIIHADENEAGATELSFEILGLDQVSIDIVENQGYFVGNDAELISLVKDGLVPLLLDKLAGDSAVFEIPTIDLGGLSESIPEGTEIGLDIQNFTREKAYLIVEGGLK